MENKADCVNDKDSENNSDCVNDIDSDNKDYLENGLESDNFRDSLKSLNSEKSFD